MTLHANIWQSQTHAYLKILLWSGFLSCTHHRAASCPGLPGTGSPRNYNNMYLTCPFPEHSPLSCTHHRAASCPGFPGDGTPCDYNNAYNPDRPNPHVITGALVGGPGVKDDYVDKRSDFMKNEVACDYNAGYTGALAAMISSGSSSKQC